MKETLMHVSIEGRNFDLTDANKGRIEKMINKSLSIYEDYIISVMVVLDFMKHRKGGQPSAEVHIVAKVPGPDLVSTNAHDDLYEAVDFALDHLVDQVQKRREKEL